MLLAVETSCDETCAAVVSRQHVLSSVVASQALAHKPYGGVVPEIASRRHLELIIPTIRHALDQAGVDLDSLDAIAVTAGPGLIGALLVGVATAKAYAFARTLPLIPVDHLHGHVASLYLEPDPLAPPFLCLLASGGHTLLLAVEDHRRIRCLGRSLDDAAGEAFDKGARLLGLDYPGGAAIEQLARRGDASRFPFPVAMRRHPGLDMSFAGIKTALAVTLGRIESPSDQTRADLAASYQHAIVQSLRTRTEQAVRATGYDRVGVVGGVAANGELRAALNDMADRHQLTLRAAPLAYCADNAAMIGAAAHHLAPLAASDFVHLDAYARSPLA